MLNSHLQYYHKINRLYNAWIIQGYDLEKILSELEDFIKQDLLKGTVPLANHTDFKLIEKPKTGTGSKSISIEQIRGLQEFLNKTASLSDNKVAIIYQADLMNLNAANSCLKILEDAAKNTYIFLLTSNSSNIIPTIRSRCQKIEFQRENQQLADSTYESYLPLLIHGNMDERLSFLKELSDKNKEVWLDFSAMSLSFLSKAIKSLSGINVHLNDDEIQIFQQFKSKSLPYFLKKFESLNKLLNNSINYDLDLKASFIIALNLFES